MKIIEQGFEILDDIDECEILSKLEKCGRVCYKSYNKITDDSKYAFVKNLIKVGHESVIEHQSITVMLTTSRSVTHELVRHRLASYSQMSQRYVEDDSIEFILPEGNNDCDAFYRVFTLSEIAYKGLRNLGLSKQIARAVLPNACATKIVVTANLREWRHIFKERAINKAAHPDIRALMLPLLKEFQHRLPTVFGDLKGNE